MTLSRTPVRGGAVGPGWARLAAGNHGAWQGGGAKARVSPSARPRESCEPRGNLSQWRHRPRHPPSRRSFVPLQKSLAATAAAVIPCWLAACAAPKPVEKYEPEAPKNYARELPPGAMALEKITDPA